ncbi:hypothetical protein FRC02_007755 [Tulasnella sp. 418]|nr:hypothetical protein FRC02_007755 [Tulasnella sp. 418]
MTASALPIELYHTIFQHVTNKNDLCSLARCSSTFQSLAEPFIYHFISSKYQIKFIKAAQSTISRPHRHRLVKTLHLRSFWSPEAFNHSALPRLMAKLLRVTSQLRALRIDGFVRSMWILKSCSHPLLTTLGIVTPASHMDSQVEVNNQRYDRQYLERHANITKLVLRVVGNLPVIGWDASHHLPNLDTLYYIGPRTSFLLKDRDLQRVRLRFNSVNYDTEELVSHLSSMRATLQVLDLSEFHGLRQSWSLQSMQGFLRNLPSLRLFGLPLSKSHNVSNQLTTNTQINRYYISRMKKIWFKSSKVVHQHLRS